MIIGIIFTIGVTFAAIQIVRNASKPTPEPTPAPSPAEDTTTYVVKKGDTLGAILRAYGYKGNKLFGDSGLAQKVAEQNGIKNRGLIYPNQKIVINKALFNVY